MKDGLTHLCRLSPAATAEFEIDDRFRFAGGSLAERMGWTEERRQHRDRWYVFAMSDRPVEKPNSARVKFCLDAQLQVTRKELIVPMNSLDHGSWQARRR